MKLSDMMIQHIKETLIRFNGNKTHAAKSLGMSPRWIRYLTNRNPNFAEFKKTKLVPREGKKK